MRRSDGFSVKAKDLQHKGAPTEADADAYCDARAARIRFP
jgi:hypothetical protein